MRGASVSKMKHTVSTLLYQLLYQLSRNESSNSNPPAIAQSELYLVDILAPRILYPCGSKALTSKLIPYL